MNKLIKLHIFSEFWSLRIIYGFVDFKFLAFHALGRRNTFSFFPKKNTLGLDALLACICNRFFLLEILETVL